MEGIGVANSRREKELARQRAERQAARRAAAAARRRQRNAIIASILAVALVAGGALSLAAATRGGDDSTVATPDAADDPTRPPKAPLPPGSCEYTPTGLQPARPAPVPAATDVEDTAAFTVTLTTSQGPITFEAPSAKAPCTVNSFRSLAESGYFNDTPCHRLTTAGISVLQCGDPTGTGGGDPGYKFPDENLEGATYPRGTVAMANSGPDTNGSQFFLVYADSSLPPSYTPFGTITAGLDVLDKVAAAGVQAGARSGDGKPALPVQIQTVQVAAKAT